MNDITVLISSYNPGHYLKKAIDSVFDQTYPDWKIILIDDGSTDNSLLQINEYLRNPRIRLERNPQNIGLTKSLNIGLGLVDTPYVVQLDSDDWFEPRTLKIMVNEAQKQPDDVAVFYGNYSVVSQDKKGKVKSVIITKGQKYKDRYHFLLSNNTVRPRFYRVSCLKKIGGWPTGYPYEDRYFEDKRILLRLAKHFRFYWIDELLYNYRKHTCNLTKNRSIYNDTFEWLIKDALNYWEDQSIPVFEINKQTGWKRVVRLIPKSSAQKLKDGQ